MERTTDSTADTANGREGQRGACSRTVIQIGDAEADPTTNIVRRGQDTIHLEPKAMEVLCFLVDRQGQVVTRDELLSALWPGLVVGGDTLTLAVIKLRKAFGDDRRTPRYIETVPKRGYRLIASVGAAVDGPQPSPMRRPGVGAVRSDAWTLSTVAAAGAASMLAVGLWLHRGWEQPNPLSEGVAVAAVAAPGPVRGASPAVVVVPFRVLGDHPEQQYLADGLAAELAADLSRMS